MDGVEHEVCANCKKEIPQFNYVMHTAHCARNITLCRVCNEPVPKNQFEEHQKLCVVKTKSPVKLAASSSSKESSYFSSKKIVEKEVKESTGTIKKVVSPEKPKASLLPCKYCELELPKLDLQDHEDYCGSRTDKCLECGELVMFKYKQLHLDSNHGFLKLKEEPGPRASWDSTTSISAGAAAPRRRPPPLTNFSSFDYDPMPYLPSSYQTPGQQRKKDKNDSYKEISRRLDCKTEYIRNLLHDSASITVPLRHSGAVPRNHFNHTKGPAPQPPRRRNPPTELTIACEFCDVPIPHDDLLDHERACRPNLPHFNPRRRSLDLDEDFFVAPPAQASSPEVQLPCEFCADLIPASQLLRHQATCS